MVHHSGELLVRRLWLGNLLAFSLLLLFSILPSSLRLVPVGPVMWLPLVFFWRVRGVGLPMLLLLPMAFAQDALQGLPMGASVMVYVLASWTIEHYRRWLFKESFIEEWLVFIPWVALVTFGYALAAASYFASWSYVPKLMMDAVMACLLYPLVHIFSWPSYHALPKSLRHAP